MRAIRTLVVALIPLACTARSASSSLPGDGGPSANVDPNLPLADASDLGGECTGFGTSIGDTAAFPSDSCPAGICVADARDGLDLYCSADCTKVRCPAGWKCEETTVGSKRACLKDPNATQSEDDAGPTSWLDAELPSYRVGSSTTATASLRDYADPAKDKRDLIVLVFSGAWSTINQAILEDSDTRYDPRVTWISVLVEGPTFGEPATGADFAKWHKNFPGVDKMLDPGLVALRPAIKKPLSVFPTFVGLDAATLDYVGELAGTANLKKTVDAWKEKAAQ